jgi:hypothetical protein
MSQEKQQIYITPKDATTILLIARRKFDEAYALDPESRLILSGILDQIFVRVGQCNYCASCCRNSMLMINGRPITTQDEYENLCQGKPEYRKWIFKEMKEGKMFFSCSLVTKDNRCGDYENRFPLCKKYPNSGTLIPGHCGYKLTVNLGRNEIRDPELRGKIKAHARKVGLQKEVLKAIYPEAFNPLGAVSLLAKAIRHLFTIKLGR